MFCVFIAAHMDMQRTHVCTCSNGSASHAFGNLDFLERGSSILRTHLYFTKVICLAGDTYMRYVSTLIYDITRA